MDFAGDVVLVTGGGAGLGRAYAHLLATSGARVVVNDLSIAPDGRSLIGGSAQRVVDEITARGGEAVADAHSVADPDGARAAVATALERFGRIDAVINNAGIVRAGGYHRLTPDDIQAVLGVHLIGSILVTRAAWKAMKDQGYGRVVFTSSSIGLLGTPANAAYGGAKGALAGLTRVLAAEGVDHGILVNAVAPMAVTRLNEAVMSTIFGPATELLTADIVAPVAAFLVHRDCALNGEVLSAAGGRVARFALGSGPTVPGLRSPEDVRDAFDARTGDRAGALVDAAGPGDPHRMTARRRGHPALPGESTMTGDLVLRERHGAVLEIRLDNPPFNGLSGPLLVAYMEALEEARAGRRRARHRDDGQRPVVVCGRRPDPAQRRRAGEEPLGHAARIHRGDREPRPDRPSRRPARPGTARTGH